MYNPFSLEGKTILVTGASSGIGKATAIECSKAGAKVMLLGRNIDRLNETLSNCNGEGHTFIQCDLGELNSLPEKLNDLQELDGVVHNAGINTKYLVQGHFKQMQQSLAVQIGELKKLNTQLREQNEHLQEAYLKAQEADHMKIAFLHNMTNKMMEPVDIICAKVDALNKDTNELPPQEADQLANEIQRQCMIVVELLNNLLKVSERLNYKNEQIGTNK